MCKEREYEREIELTLNSLCMHLMLVFLQIRMHFTINQSLGIIELKQLCSTGKHSYPLITTWNDRQCVKFVIVTTVVAFVFVCMPFKSSIVITITTKSVKIVSFSSKIVLPHDFHHVSVIVLFVIK